ncbi:MAG TPA: MFS transporter [Chloroflexia bacterium]|nr:MFS transporter [Chloroflexia bacterium]
MLLENYRSIASNRSFMGLWSGLLISNFGDRLTEFGLAWYILGRTNNPLDVGLSFLIFQLPALFSGLLAGWLLDHFRREHVMLADNLLRGGLVTLIPLLSAGPGLPLPVLYLIIAMLGALSVVTQVGSRTLVTDYVPPEQYNVANSLSVMQSQLSAIAGPALAGLLVELIGPLTLMWLDSATFFVFALLLLWLGGRPVSSPSGNTCATTSVAPARFWRQLLEGVRFTFQRPLLLVLLSVSFWWNFGLGIYQVALPFYCNGPLGAGPLGMGAILAVNSAGVLLSAFIFGPLRPRYPGRVTCLMLLVQALCYGLLGGLPVFSVALVLSFTLGAFDDLAAIYLTTIRQRSIPAPLMGRVLAFTGTVGPAGTPLGSVLSGTLVAGFGPALVVGLSGLPLLLIGLLWLSVGPLREVRDSSD